MKCVHCGSEFKRVRNAKTCSPTCSAAHTAKRQRDYIKAHPQLKREIERRHRKLVHRYGRHGRMLNRAVRLLFQMTGEQHG